MVSDITTIAVIITLNPFIINIWITIHFGRNPMNGGSPLNDSRVMNSIYLIVDFLLTIITWLINEILYAPAISVIVEVNMEYIIKYIIHKLSPPSIAANIQPVWLIDEYVRIFRKDVWFIPPIAPTIIDVIIIILVMRLVFIRYEINIIGAIFWIVIINKQFIHLSPSITLGNHQCNGAAPVFSSKGVIII
jgi:hypothetical protein